MSDEQENVEVQTEPVETETEAPATGAVESTDAETTETVDAQPSVNADGSRTGFVQTGRPGDTCVCPDGRTGTVHRFDEGLICIPNADQG